VLDKVGENINQKGDGHIGEQTFLHEDGMVTQIRCSRNDCYFILLSGVPLMCVVIFSGKRHKPVKLMVKRFSTCVHGRLRDLRRLIYLPRPLRHLMYLRSSIVPQAKIRLCFLMVTAVDLALVF